MIDGSVINQVLEIEDDRSGDHAQDGFDFQASAAIYLMMKEIDTNNDFAFVYEKIDDFIIFANDIRLYQAKSTSKNLTDNDLFKKDKKSKEEKNTEVGLSIIEKMQNNYTAVKNTIPDVDVKSYLIWNKDFKISKVLLKGTKIKEDIQCLTLNNISNEVKDKIILNTILDEYEWDNIEILRLLPKSSHTELTCNYIEEVIYRKIGNNSSYSKAFYNALYTKIKDSRQKKDIILSGFLSGEILKLRIIPQTPKPNEYQYLLTVQDYRNQIIHTYVKEVFDMKNIKHNSLQKHLDILRSYINTNIQNISFPCDLCNQLKQMPAFAEIFLLNSDEKVKAMIINIYLERVN